MPNTLLVPNAQAPQKKILKTSAFSRKNRQKSAKVSRFARFCSFFTPLFHPTCAFDAKSSQVG